MARRKKLTKPVPAARKKGSLPAVPETLVDELRRLIRQTHEGVAQAVNSALVLLYWQVSQRIRTEVLNQQRATYGEEIVVTASRQLTAEFGNGFSRANLFRMIRLTEVFPQQEIVSTLSRQLSWSPFIEIILLDDPSNSTSTPRYAGSNGGAPVPCATRSRACSLNASSSNCGCGWYPDRGRVAERCPLGAAPQLRSLSRDRTG